MARSKKLRISVPENGTVSGLLALPTNPIACLVFAHGAGAGMTHPAMTALSEVLNTKGIATLRFQFPYMERGSKRTDSPKVAVAAIEAAVKVATKALPNFSVFAGGKSFGGRMTTTAASLGKLGSVQGIVCFSFPLHPAKQPGVSRAEHLKEVHLPVLWLQGTRDDLADLKLIRKVVKKHKDIHLHVIEGADHSFGVLKSSGRTASEVLEEVSDACLKFVRHK